LLLETQNSPVQDQLTKKRDTKKKDKKKDTVTQTQRQRERERTNTDNQSKEEVVKKGCKGS
jgi:hypothetical protein